MKSDSTCLLFGSYSTTCFEGTPSRFDRPTGVQRSQPFKLVIHPWFTLHYLSNTFVCPIVPHHIITLLVPMHIPLLLFLNYASITNVFKNIWVTKNLSMNKIVEIFISIQYLVKSHCKILECKIVKFWKFDIIFLIWWYIINFRSMQSLVYAWCHLP